MSNAPKLFISYSWSSPEHEQWVIDLATQLRESGVDVILDKWELKEGHDSISFMEKMVTDPSISKVAVISDKAYAEKADGRAGGVGTETQIISREVYEKQDQGKFVAVLPEKDGHGKAYLPTYYKGRIYIDLSESDRYGENFEKLLRWIFDKPLHVKPEIGKPPSYLDESESISLGTSAAHHRFMEAVRTGKPFAFGALDEYFRIFTENLERFRLHLKDTPPSEFDEKVVESIDQFTPYRNEFIQTLIAISQYSPNREAIQKLHRFFERVMKYMYPLEGMTQWNTFDFDNYKFIVHELFLCAITILIKDERFDLVSELLTTPYYIDSNGRRDSGETVSYTHIRQYMHSFESRSKRLHRLSARADLLKNRSETSGVDFKSLMQADFILYLRSAIESDGHSSWWPETLVFSSHAYGPFEVFARSTSKSYFDRAKVVLRISSPEELAPLMDKFASGKARVPSWDWDRIEPATLVGMEGLAKRP